MSQTRVIVLGIDGMDPQLLSSLMAEGRLPAFSRLAAMGGFRSLESTIPPQSPVAWATFITGLDPGGHGIFDFLRHDHRTFAIADSGTYRREPYRLFGVPLFGGGFENLRKGKAFWEILEEAGVEASVIGIPSNFPPVGRRSRTLSGLGTPDLRGTNGSFTLFTSELPPGAEGVSGGIIEHVEVRGGEVQAVLVGPPNELWGGAPAKLPLRIALDTRLPRAILDISGAHLELAQGETSPWVRVAFPLFPGLRIRGILRFHLQEVRPVFRLLVSPIAIDPADPAMPITTPPGLAQELSAAIGPFTTQSMDSDTKALQWGLIDDEEFLARARAALAESGRMLEHELERFRGRNGLLFFYLGVVDQCSHVFWRTLDPDHPAWRPDFPPQVRDAIPAIYEETDRLLARTFREVDEKTVLIVLSDHGFAPFRRAIHLNNWLEEQGYLTRYAASTQGGQGLAAEVDWSRTRAYAVGFNGIYLNRFGREPSGTVTQDQASSLLAQISEKLRSWRDPKGGHPVVAHTALPGDVYSGNALAGAPDLIVGYARGYRASWETPLGGFGAAAIDDNNSPWSGDHLIDAAEVPGILLANRPIAAGQPRLIDLSATLLHLFGIPLPQQMQGKPLIAIDPI